MRILLRLLLMGRESCMKRVRFRNRVYRITIEPYVQAGKLKEDLAVMPPRAAQDI